MHTNDAHHEKTNLKIFVVVIPNPSLSLTTTKTLRILAMGWVKTAKISNFWTFWPVIQLMCFF